MGDDALHGIHVGAANSNRVKLPHPIGDYRPGGHSEGSRWAGLPVDFAAMSDAELADALKQAAAVIGTDNPRDRGNREGAAQGQRFHRLYRCAW